MSLQGLISGAECATPFNPLSQVLKHTEGDRSLQQDRVAGPSSSRQLQHLPSTTPPLGSERELALARQFFNGQPQGSNAMAPFTLHQQPLPDLGASMTNSGRATPDLNALWAKSSHQRFSEDQSSRAQPGHQLMNSSWTQEFGTDYSTASGQASTASIAQLSEVNQSSYMPPRMYSGMPLNMYSSIYSNPTANQQLDVSKGKGKAREIDFEAAFAQIAQSFATAEEQSAPSEQEMARIAELDDTADLAEAMERASVRDADATNDTLGSDFKTVWNHLQNSDIPPPEEDLAKWEAEYNQLLSAQRDDLDFGADMQAAWENGLGQYDDNLDTQLKFDNDGLPLLGDYVFETDNKYLDPSSSTTSPLEEAKSLLDRGGSLTEVALLLEAAIQKGELGNGGYEAWILLGEVRSMDEREEAGMKALAEGVKRAEQAGASGEGMLSLAISYTNESYDRAAHTTLLRWLAARYPSFKIPEQTWQSLSQSSWHSNELVTEAFLNLARQQHEQGIIDADLQAGLGVLSYNNGQYDRAKDCFEAALNVRPDDFLLWNRLGSSLSNGNHPEEALGAYREALQRRPTYTRAIYNVGVACLNIGAHKEAAEHFLSGLAMQDSSAGPKSEQLWTTLRRTFQMMNRPDLAEKATSGADVNIFRSEGFDF